MVCLCLDGGMVKNGTEYLWVSTDALLPKQCFNLENEKFTLKYVVLPLQFYSNIIKWPTSFRK